MTIKDSPYYCKYCKKVIRIGFKLHMMSEHGVGIIELKNKSTIYVTTDKGKYHNVKGKSIKYIKLDEFIE